LAISPLNRGFLKELEALMDNWNDRSSLLGPLFIKYAPFFKMYITYCNSHQKAVNELRKLLKKKSLFKDFVESARKYPRTKGLDIESFLIMPIQRIPRYTLLLKELLKHTPTSHLDHKHLLSAFENMTQLTAKINDEIRIQESRDRVLQIQALFTGKQPDLVAPNRRFIMEGELTKVCRKEDKAFRFFLFNDLLIYGHPNGYDQYVLHHQIPIDALFQVVDVDHMGDRHPFQIRSSTKSFMVYTRDPVLKQKWIDAMSVCVEEIHASVLASKDDGTVMPIWVQDKDAKECSICSELFTFLNRRHHCRKCGDVIDAKCSRFLVFDGKKQRLCTGCANEVVAERSGVTKRKSLKTAEGSDMGILEEVKKQFPTASDLDPFSPPTVPDSALKPPPVRIGFGVPADLAAALKTYSPGSTGEIKPPVSTHTSDGYSYANESSEDADNPDDFEVLSVTIEPKHHESEEVQEEAPKTRSGTIVKLKKNILTAQKSRAPEKSKYNLAYEVGDQVKVFMKKPTCWYVESQRTKQFGWIDPADFV